MDFNPTQTGDSAHKEASAAERPRRRQRTEIRLAWFIGSASLVIYFLTLCPNVYPGSSADSVAAVLNLLPQSPITHPVWRFAASMAAKIPLLDIPFRLNFLSALCGAMAVVILFRLTSRVLLEFFHNEALMDAITHFSEEDSEDDDVKHIHADSLQTDINSDAGPMLGGLLTAFAFAFGVPFWSASVSLHPQTFDLLLLFTMASLLARYILTGSSICCMCAAFLYGLGAVESALFIVTTPIVLFLLFKVGNKYWLFSESFTRLFFFPVLLGIGIGTAVLIGIASVNDALNLHKLTLLFRDIVRSHQLELALSLPHMGWLIAPLETIIPFVAVVWGTHKFLTSHELLAKRLQGVLNTAFTLVAAACLLSFSNTPWGLARLGGHLPIISSLATAATIGLLFSYWHLLKITPARPYDDDDYYIPPTRFQCAFSCCMMALILAVVLLTPFRNIGDADGRKGAFADPIARELLALAGDARCLVTDGVLDTHILIQASLHGRSLTLTPVSPADDLAKTSIEPPAQLTAKPPQKVSPGDLIEQRLQAESNACHAVAIVAQPSLWTQAGLCAVPNGLVYLGAEKAQAINGPHLLSQHEALWSTLFPLLVQDLERPPALASLLSDVRRHASRVANDLGVFLEAQGCDTEADRAYGQALCLDKGNLCATFNRYGLWLRNPSFGNPSEQEHLIQLAAEQLGRGFLFEKSVSRYGTLRIQPPGLLEPQNAIASTPLVVQWIAYCRSQTATSPQLIPTYRDKVSAKRITLAQATQSLRTGDLADAEALLRSYLSTNPEDISGWSVLADLLLKSNRVDDVVQNVLPSMRKAAGETGNERVDMTEGNLALHQAPSNYRDARTFFTRALAHHPNLKEAQDQLLQTDRLLGETALTESDAADVLKTDINHCAANAIMGSIRLKQDRYDEAEKHLRRSVATFPTADALTDLAKLLRAKAKLPEAEKCARHALEIAPNSYQAWDTLGNVLTDQNRLSEADAAIRCALSFCATDPSLHLNLARLNLKLNRQDEVRQLLSLAAPMVAHAKPSIGKDFAALSQELDARAAPH